MPEFSTTSLIAAGIVIVAIGIIFGIKIYKHYKNSGEKFDLKTFIDKYGDQIIAVLKDVVKLLKLDENDYSSKESYEKAIIERTIKEIKQNYKELGFEIKILNLIDDEALANAIYDILHGNAINIFSVLDTEVINSHKELYDEQVVSALKAKEDHLLA